jgi:tRNA(fMet)-specific endonuclease VapC
LKVVDTTFLVCLMRNDPRTTQKAVELDEAGGAATTVINVYEAMHGAYRSFTEQEKRLGALRRVIANLEILDLDYGAACKAAEISGTLEREGRGIDPFDSLIAGITLTCGAEALVTRNTDHFNRIKGLPVESH